MKTPVKIRADEIVKGHIISLDLGDCGIEEKENCEVLDVYIIRDLWEADVYYRSFRVDDGTTRFNTINFKKEELIEVVGIKKTVKRKQKPKQKDFYKLACDVVSSLEPELSNNYERYCHGGAYDKESIVIYIDKCKSVEKMLTDYDNSASS